MARPVLIESLQDQILPENLATAFAGNDGDAVDRARQQYFVGCPPSSPCAALFREGRLVHMIGRHQIEGQSVEILAKMFRSAYDKYCGEQMDESVEICDSVVEL